MSVIRINQKEGAQVTINGGPQIKVSTTRGERGPPGNQVFVTQNTNAAALVTSGINFVNTSTITVSVANSANGYANVAFTAVGGAAFDQANLAYSQANTARNTANSAYAQANIAYGSANTVTVSQNGGSTLANKQLNFVNSASILASISDSGDGNANISFATSFASPGDAYAQANLAYDQANSAYLQANAGYAQANAAYLQANTGYSQANAAYLQANAGYSQANNAYAEANLKLDIAGGTITGSLNVDTDLYVKGDISLDGNLIIGNVNTDTISVIADFTSNLIPDVTETFSLGTNAKQWKEIHVASANVQVVNLSGDLVASETSNLKVGGTTTLNTSYISANVVISGPTETTYNVFTTNADTPIVIDSFSSAKFTTVKYIIQSKSVDGYHATELFCMQDGIEAYITEYATLINNYTLGSYSLTVSGGVCNLYFNPNNPSHNIITVKLVRTALTT